MSDSKVMAGNGTIGLEIVEDLPDVETVLVPYGGGGLSCGIAAALEELRPKAGVWACEVETAAPLAASWAVGKPVAAALPGAARGTTVCDISGGNLDADVLTEILAGRVPAAASPSSKGRDDLTVPAKPSSEG